MSYLKCYSIHHIGVQRLLYFGLININKKVQHCLNLISVSLLVSNTNLYRTKDFESFVVLTRNTHCVRCLFLRIYRNDPYN